jgi:hypothetical protein
MQIALIPQHDKELNILFSSATINKLLVKGFSVLYEMDFKMLTNHLPL